MKSEHELTASIALYNNADTIKRAIESIQRQTWQGDLEILVVDDGSKDHGVDVVEDMLRVDPRIRLIRLPRNRGLGHVRTVQVEQSTGEYLAFLDADDQWMPEKIEKQFAVLAETSANHRTNKILCGANCLCVDRDSNRQYVMAQPNTPFEMSDVLRWAMSRPAPGVASHLGRRQTFRDVGPFDEELKRCQDWDFAIRFYQEGGRFVFVPGAPLYEYHYTRIHRDALLEEQAVRYLLAKHRALYDHHGLYAIQLSAMLFDGIARMYTEQGKLYESLQRMAEAAAINPSTYGDRFIAELRQMCIGDLEEKISGMRLDRQLMRGIGKLWRVNRRR